MSFSEQLAVHADLAAGDMHVGAPSRRQRELCALRTVEATRVHACVLVDPHRTVGAVRRGDQAQPAALVRVGEMLLLVARVDAAHVRLDPDLQEVHGLALRPVELAVQHAAAGAHPLHVAGTDHRAGARRVLVRERALEHVADDLHVAVAVRREAGAGHDAVLVDDPQRPELDVLGVEVVGERERVVRAEPAVVGIATVVGTSDLDHRTPPCWVGGQHMSDQIDKKDEKSAFCYLIDRFEAACPAIATHTGGHVGPCGRRGALG